jgi:hypothetical protein
LVGVVRRDRCSCAQDATALVPEGTVVAGVSWLLEHAPEVAEARVEVASVLFFVVLAAFFRVVVGRPDGGAGLVGTAVVQKKETLSAGPVQPRF